MSSRSKRRAGKDADYVRSENATGGSRFPSPAATCNHAVLPPGTFSNDHCRPLCALGTMGSGSPMSVRRETSVAKSPHQRIQPTDRCIALELALAAIPGRHVTTRYMNLFFDFQRVSRLDSNGLIAAHADGFSFGSPLKPGRRSELVVFRHFGQVGTINPGFRLASLKSVRRDRP